MRRQFTDPERLALLQDYLNGSASQYAFERQHGLFRGAIYVWLRRFALQDKAKPMRKNQPPASAPALPDELIELRQELERLKLKNKDLEAKNKELQSKLKHEALGHEAYKMLVELAEETYGIEILKNSDAK